MKTTEGKVVWTLTLWSVSLLLTAWAAGCDSPPKSNEDDQDKRPKRKKLGETRGYVHAVVRSRTVGETRLCLARMAMLKQELQLHAQMNDNRFPKSLKELKRPKLIRTPMRGEEEYSYVPGQSTDSNANNILVYLSEVDHEGKCHVLRVGGVIETIEPADLEEQLGQQGVTLPE